MKIRRTFLWELVDNGLAKAIALLLFYKNRYKSSTVHNFTYNKIHKETNLHITTIKKRIATLKRLNLVTIKDGHLTFRCVSSHNNSRNVMVVCENLSVKEIEYSIKASMFLEIQRHKDYAKHIIQVATNCPEGTTSREFKRAKKLCIEYGYGREYKEFGLSYKTIAKKINVSLATAVKIVNFAVARRMVIKRNHFRQVYVQSIGFARKYVIEKVRNGFITKNNLYQVYANTYSII